LCPLKPDDSCPRVSKFPSNICSRTISGEPILVQQSSPFSHPVIIQVFLPKENYLFRLFHAILSVFWGIILPTHFNDEPKKEREKRLADNNNAGLNKIETIFNKAEEEIKCIDSDTAVAEIDESSLKDFVNGLWSTVYSSALLTFISSIEASHQVGKVDEKEYGQINPLLTKWTEITNLHKIDQQYYSDFESDLKDFSEQYPQWTVKDKSIFNVFQDNIWKPWFEKYSIRANNISKKYEQSLERKTNKYYLMAKSNYTFISPYEFEKVVAQLFERMGYKVELTSKSGDYGIDVIARYEQDVIAIQTKKYGSSPKSVHEN
jgi:hypothetical protein